MASGNGMWLWRLAALFFGAFLVLAMTALTAPAGELVPARVAQSPSEPAEPSPADSSEAPTNQDRPSEDQTAGLSRMVGTPSVQVEVLGDVTPDIGSNVVDGTESFDEQRVGQVDSTEPAAQVEQTPQFTG